MKRPIYYDEGTNPGNGWRAPEELQEVQWVRELREVFKDLVEWERFMGGFEAPVWDRVRKLHATMENE